MGWAKKTLFFAYFLLLYLQLTLTANIRDTTYAPLAPAHIFLTDTCMIISVHVVTDTRHRKTFQINAIDLNHTTTYLHFIFTLRDHNRFDLPTQKRKIHIFLRRKLQHGLYHPKIVRGHNL